MHDYAVAVYHHISMFLLIRAGTMSCDEPCGACLARIVLLLLMLSPISLSQCHSISCCQL
jgi:hypothetical protein